MANTIAGRHTITKWGTKHRKGNWKGFTGGQIHCLLCTKLATVALYAILGSASIVI